MAVYATRDDVLARAGRIGTAFSIAGKRPNLADIDAFLDELSVEVDEAIRARGFDPTALDANAKKSLLDLVAYGAVARAVRALGDRSPEVLSVLTEADAVWTLGIAQVTDGTFGVLAALEAGQAGGGAVVTAGSFWGDEENYGRPESLQQEYIRLRGTNLAPGMSKGQHL